jgi:ABC-type glycerol-3-phosphate transport system substrate-binding protein
VLFSNGYSLWAGAKQQQGAIEVMAALTTPAMMLEWAKRTGRTPTRTSLTDDYAKMLNIPADPPPSYVKVAEFLADKIEGLPLTPNYVDWQKILTTQVLTPVAKGQVSAADAVRNAAPAINALLAKA